MKTAAQTGLLLSISGLPGLRKNSDIASNFDLIIKKGTIIDGIRDTPYKADLGISGERIKAIGNLSEASSKAIIDASEKTIAPGFIDIHSHTDLELLVNPKAESKIRQGITTELSGNCGGSVFPLKKHFSPEERRIGEKLGLNIDWVDLEGYYSRLSKEGMAINHATLLGQATLRSYVMGKEKREPKAQEMEMMKHLAAETMEQGAFGLSTGLEYAPSGFAKAEEILELCQVVAKYGGFYASHIRSEDLYILEAIGESLFIAEKGEIPLQISHLKVSGKINWWKQQMIIDLIERAGERGILVTADCYPYTAYSTGLSVFFPHWALDGGAGEFVKRLKDKELREKMREETVEKVIGNNSWESILIVEVSREENRSLEGKNLSDIAASRKKDPYQLACDLLVEEEGDVSIVGFGMSEENIQLLLKHPLLMLCSDGSALAPYGLLSRGVPHPRNYGAFPRFLGLYVREKKLIPLPQAIKKMTSLPAAKMGLEDRGSIKEGNFADLVIFDPSKISDTATYFEPENYPEGIDYVLVNGRIVIDHGQQTGELPGKVLHGPGKK